MPLSICSELRISYGQYLSRESAFFRVISTVCFYGIVPTIYGDRDPQNDLPQCEMTCPTV